MFDKNLILDEANKRCQGTLVSTLGITFIDVGEHYLEAKMEVTSAHHQPAGVLHGGKQTNVVKALSLHTWNYFYRCW